MRMSTARETALRALQGTDEFLDNTTSSAWSHRRSTRAHAHSRVPDCGLIPAVCWGNGGSVMSDYIPNSTTAETPTPFTRSGVPEGVEVVVGTNTFAPKLPNLPSIWTTTLTRFTWSGLPTTWAAPM